MKKIAKKLVASILGWQTKRLINKNHPKVVAVAGSMGKTSTKLAIAQVLSQGYTVRWQTGNYNDLISVPLIFFGQDMPSLFNPLAWLKIFGQNEQVIQKPYPYEIVVVELGTDAPGQIADFKRYLKVDLGVLTAISPEHMQFFNSLDAVAREETALAALSTNLLVNIDLCDTKYLAQIGNNFQTYGIHQPADYQLTDAKFGVEGYQFRLLRGNSEILKTTYHGFAKSHLYSLAAALSVGHLMGLNQEQLIAGLNSIKPVNGRMQKLKGVNGSTILDDTYNASPQATMAALDTLYQLQAPYKIAILGSMNELGNYSQEAHKQVGEHCDPRQLELLITIGKEANQWLAPVAQAAGCAVKTFDGPYQAGQTLKTLIKKGSLILAKGSQNGVFAEEAVKQILANPDDAQLLVRQSPLWLNKKASAFK